MIVQQANYDNESEMGRAFDAKFFSGLLVEHEKGGSDFRVIHVTNGIIGEYKYKLPFIGKNGTKNIITALSQALHYLRDIRIGKTTAPRCPVYIMLVEIETVVILRVSDWIKFCDDATQDWGTAASNPSTAFKGDVYRYYTELKHSGGFIDIYKYRNNTTSQAYCKYKDDNELLDFIEKNVKTDYTNILGNEMLKIKITETNYLDAYELWLSIFKECIKQNRTQYKPSSFFIETLKGNYHYTKETNRIIFDAFDTTLFLQPDDYKIFFDKFEESVDAYDLEVIISSRDTMDELLQRRRNGEYYTPAPFAARGLEMVADNLGADWYKHYKIWDMAAGTGNLLLGLPSHENVYMSTLEEEEVDILNDIDKFKDSIIFQYDYLNDDVDNLLHGSGSITPYKMPAALRADILNEGNGWVIIINPPFALATSGVSKGVHITKNKVSKTKIGKYCKSAEDLYTQFIVRLAKELPKAKLVLYSPLRHLTHGKLEPFRDDVFHYKFMDGFMFSSEVFDSTQAGWGVGCMMWDLSQDIPIHEQDINLRVYDKTNELCGSKKIITVAKEKLLNMWCEPRPKNTNISSVPCIPLKNFNTISDKGIRLKRLNYNALGFYNTTGNDSSQNKYNSFYSSAFGSGNGWAILPDTFEKTMVVIAVKMAFTNGWINAMDQFYIPRNTISDEFITDCVVLSLFSSASNKSSAVQDKTYGGFTYGIKNNFFPFLIKQVNSWKPKDLEDDDKGIDDSDRFAATWLNERVMSDEAWVVLNEAMVLYEKYYKNIEMFDADKYWLGDWWDVGLLQVLSPLKDSNPTIDNILKEKLSVLSKKIEEKSYNYGFYHKEGYTEIEFKCEKQLNEYFLGW